MVTYLSVSGIRVKYDIGQKRYALNASKNEFVKNLLLKYSKNLLVIDEKPNEITNTTNIAVEQVTNPNEMAPEVVEKFKDDPAGPYFFRIGWGVDKVSALDS